MIDSIDSKHNEVGDVFRASLETDLVGKHFDRTSRQRRLWAARLRKEAGHFSGSSELQLELTRLIIDGREFPIVSGDYTLREKDEAKTLPRKLAWSNRWRHHRRHRWRRRGSGYRRGRRICSRSRSANPHARPPGKSPQRNPTGVSSRSARHRNSDPEIDAQRRNCGSPECKSLQAGA